MDTTGALISVLVGLLCAGAGILALPAKSPTAPDGRTRAVLIGTAAALPVLGCILWLGHPLAAGLPFVLGTLVAGQLRDRGFSGRSARGRDKATEGADAADGEAGTGAEAGTATVSEQGRGDAARTPGSLSR